MTELKPSDATRTKVPYVLLGLAAAVALVTVLLTYALLRQHGDTNGWGFLQALKDATVPIVVVLTLAGLAFSARRTRPIAVMAVAVALVSLLGIAVAGQAAVSAKYAAYPRTPDCSASGPTTAGKDGSLDPRTTVGLAKIQAALGALSHPSPFTGTLETSSIEPNGASCLAGLATSDVSGAVSFYRTHIARQGWIVRDASPTRLVATKGGLTLTVDQGDGESPRVRVTYLPS